METLLFWTLPVLTALLGLKGRLIAGWRLFFASAAALYAGFWLAPKWWSLLDFLPPEAEPYRNGAAIAVGALAIFSALYFGAKAITQCEDDAFNFPTIPERALNALCRFGFGVCLSTFLMLLCEVTPLRMLTRNDGAGFEARAEEAMLAVTRVGDALTRTRPSQLREEALTSFRYVPPEPPEEENDKAQKPEKGAAPAGGKKDKAAPPTGKAG